MSKKLAGKRWFHALGQSHEVRKIPCPDQFKLSKRNKPVKLPDWAVLYYWQGRFDAAINNAKLVDYKPPHTEMKRDYPFRFVLS